MKKTMATPEIPDAGGSFSSAGAMPDLCNDTNYVTSGEQQAFEILLEIGQVYCTPGGDRMPTWPRMYPSIDQRWGPYHFAFMPYAMDDEAFCAGDTPDETVTSFNPAVCNGVRQMMGDLFLHAVGDVESHSAEDCEIVSFRSIEMLLNTCNAVIQSEDFPAGPHKRLQLKNRVMEAVKTVAREKGLDANDPAFTFH